ncbi:Probable ubiquitin carboxyl-terminal hydrolase 16 [Taphrina deformans PYCC 5710]|uniref:Ubiquitin carboxyl-terminal hydrolase n=1 Tax=Taphrina deformans (strain PYCC 5710 / ATCC 11124 / CBS 356.35 / IMI 108563 / JCM 9778 / NBRC 8474) TaxID=1097556 RepID=R5A1R0_TAPDE|nr:Probable ubiquitin carboxyl-terminal hydrolase 16 [Taphrina deformans PYCC 5710]|eukprot:CCX35442.1 Probable ubiquitin carboxyl-terminal hydrolase 16 [Taphrina deformans PYCC 5710]
MIQLAQRVSLQALLDKPVEFVKASVPFGHSITKTVAADAHVSPRGEPPQRKESIGDALKEPSKVLFPPNSLSRSWHKIMRPPPGLVNTGNTCFLNSVMQALMHIPGLVIYLQSHQHSQDCRLNNCVFCKLEDHVKKAYPGNGSKRGSIFKPAYTQNIKQIGKQFRTGRQEDAHEFLLLLLDSLQQNSLQGQPKNLDIRAKETTVVHRMFGGHLRQQITCNKCKAPSNTYEATLVLSLDCLSTIEQGLSRLTAPENLTGRNRYRCEKCKSLQEARKQTTIYDAPDNLLLHIKRFQFASKSSKITKPVAFEEKLDLARFMSPGRPSATYSLTGVVVHQGSGVSSGHYYAFGKGSNATWNEFNDDSVSQAGSARVLKQQAYMLFYTREDRPANAKTQPQHVSNNEIHGTVDLLGSSNSIARPKTKSETKTSEARSFDQMTGGNFKKRKHNGSDTNGGQKKNRIFAQMRGKNGR